MDNMPLQPETPPQEFQVSPKRRNTAFAIVIIVFIAFGIAALVNRNKVVAPTVNTNTETAAGPFTTGDVLSVNFNTDSTNTSGIAAIAVDQESYSLFTRLAQDPTGSLDTLFQNNKIFTVANGTQVKVIESHAAATKVQIKEGPEINKTGWVSNDFLFL
jgi:hypothetical protein